MITAATLADTFTHSLVELCHQGEDRAASGIEVVEVDGPVRVERGDVVLLVGPRTLQEALAGVDAVRDSAGVVLRRTWSDHPDVRAHCAEAGLTLLGVADEAPWSSALAVLRSAVEPSPVGAVEGSTDHAYSDLFDVADTIGAIVDAPITIEDATSRVLAYSTGQVDVDEARTSTIVGRRVPREVRDHFRALGVFRRLARSDEPVFVPADDGARARYVIPVRAGGEWLGSVWAVMDAPPPAGQARELAAATELVALYLLRLRARSELHRQVQLDQVRSALRGSADRTDWLDEGPWQAAVLDGPAGLGTEPRRELWFALTRRQGWRQPLVADLDGTVLAILRTGTGPGSVAWLADIVCAESGRTGGLRLWLGTPTATVAGLERSRAEAVELSHLDPGDPDDPVVSVADAWPALVLRRATSGMAGRPLVSPVAALAASPGDRTMLHTLEAVIDCWGEPTRAARALGVHPNTVRYRSARLAEACAVDLADPAQRLAVRLELARLRASGELGRP